MILVQLTLLNLNGPVHGVVQISEIFGSASETYLFSILHILFNAQNKWVSI